MLEISPPFEGQLLTFVRDTVFVEADEGTILWTSFNGRQVINFDLFSEESDEHEQIEILHKRRNMLSAFCKLIIYGVVKMKAAADIFQHYVRVRVRFFC